MTKWEGVCESENTTVSGRTDGANGKITYCSLFTRHQLKHLNKWRSRDAYHTFQSANVDSSRDTEVKCCERRQLRNDSGAKEYRKMLQILSPVMRRYIMLQHIKLSFSKDKHPH